MKPNDVARQLRIQQWTEMIHERNARGLSINEFCKEKGMPQSRYFYWLKQVRSEANAQIMGQLSFDIENQCILNEAESLVEDGIAEEPELTTVIVRREKTNGMLDINLSDAEVEVISHECTDEELSEQFPNGEALHNIKSHIPIHIGILWNYPNTTEKILLSALSKLFRS